MGFRAALAGIAAGVLVLTLAAPTSAAYVATPAAATQATSVGAWTMPQMEAIAGKRILDAAFSTSHGRTVIVAGSEGQNHGEGLFVSDRPGERPNFRSVPGVGGDAGDHRVYRVMTSGNTLYVLMRTSATGSLIVARFFIQVLSTGTNLAYRDLVEVADSAAVPVAFDAVMFKFAVAYRESILGGPTRVSLVDAPPGPMSVVRTWTDTSGFTITSIAIGEGETYYPRIFVAKTSSAGACRMDGCAFVEYVGSSVVARDSTEAWFHSGRTITRVSGSAVFSGSTDIGSSGQLASEHATRSVFWLASGANVIQRLAPDASGAPVVAETVPAGKTITRLISGTGAVMVLFTDGSLGWLIA